MARIRSHPPEFREESVRLAETSHRSHREIALDLGMPQSTLMAVVSRLRMHEPTKAYVARRTAEGHSKLEIIRCLKRYLAREVFFLLKPEPAAVKRSRNNATRYDAGAQDCS